VLAALLDGPRAVLLPLLLPDGDLDWAVCDGDLRPGPRGLLQPPGPPLGPGAVADCALVVVPALAVDRSGTRLGRGGGSYDRALARATGPVVAALHRGELVDRLPADAHDRPVHAAVLPGEGLVRLRPHPAWSSGEAPGGMAP
jgi:5-formyltetrahydrofolate cyclo-ligase